MNFILETLNTHPDFITVTVITLMPTAIKTTHVLECSLEIKIRSQILYHFKILEWSWLFRNFHILTKNTAEV